MLRIEDLSKTYSGGIQALDGITLSIAPGMFGLLGPNGAGKSTLMKILATLLEPDSGQATFANTNVINQKQQLRQLLGYLPQDFGFYPTFTAAQMLNYFARLKGVIDKAERKSLVDALLERMNLSHARNQKVGGFSGGMRQRLGIAQAIIGKPQLLIVDEPTAGLDPEERVRFYNLLSEMVDRSTVVILSTHIVADVSSLCNQMAVIQKGRILASVAPAEAIRQLAGSIWNATVSRERAQELRANLNVISAHMVAGQTRLRVMSKHGSPGSEFLPATPTLEDYYFSLVNASLLN